MSIKMNDVKFNLRAIAKDEKVLVVEVRDYYKYVNGVKESVPSGKTYVCVLPKLRYETIRVKTLDKVAVVSDDELNNSDGIYIKFSDDFNASFYTSGNDYNKTIGISCKATSAVKVTSK